MQTVAKLLKNADAILVGASNGFSIAEGIFLFGLNEEFALLCREEIKKYHFQSMLSACMAQWQTEEEKWSFWCKLIQHYCEDYQASAPMQELKTILQDKEYFILTSNGEHHFHLAGFEKERICEIEGSWLEMQCAHACHPTIYPVSTVVEAYRQGNLKIPTCPHCGGRMELHVQKDNYFIRNHKEEKALQKFINDNSNKNLVLLELGVGMRHATIKPLFYELAKRGAKYVSINKSDIYFPQSIEKNSYALYGDLTEILSQIQNG